MTTTAGVMHITWHYTDDICRDCRSVWCVHDTY